MLVLHAKIGQNWLFIIVSKLLFVEPEAIIRED